VGQSLPAGHVDKAAPDARWWGWSQCCSEPLIRQCGQRLFPKIAAQVVEMCRGGAFAVFSEAAGCCEEYGTIYCQIVMHFGATFCGASEKGDRP